MKRARTVLSSLTVFSVHDRRLYSPVWRCCNALAGWMHERNTCLLNARTAMSCTTMLLMMHVQNAPSRTRSSVPSAATHILLHSQNAHIAVSITTRSSQCQLQRFSIRTLCILMAKARTEEQLPCSLSFSVVSAYTSSTLEIQELESSCCFSPGPVSRAQLLSDRVSVI
jgi:hypothetical protein